MTENCPVCLTAVRKVDPREPGDYIECERCGGFLLTGTARAVLGGTLENRARARVSHAICKMSQAGPWPRISSDLLRELLSNSASPTPPEQLDNLISWLGSVQRDPGTRVDFSPRLISATGAVDVAGLGFIVSEAVDRGLVDCHIQEIQVLGPEPAQYMISPMRLTINGWRHFEALKRGRIASRIAFMAMSFGDPELNRIYRDHFQAAVALTGFRLKRLDEDQPAGLIDDRLRVEIRQCRFLISDLTHRNPGAYWEAGYAEGLGKPVIYTCREDVFADKTHGPHFDANHHLIVTWKTSALDATVEKLKATIRATLPDEALISDAPVS